VIENLKQLVNNLNKTKIYLILTSIFLVFFLVLLNNFKVIPLRTGDFVFFALFALAIALYRPGWGFLFFIGTIVLENINLAPSIIGISVRPFQLLGALILLAVAIRFFSKKIYFKLPKLEWHDYALLTVVFSGFLSIINASDKIVSFKLAIIFATFFALYYLVRIYIQNSEDIKRIIPFFISSGIVVILYGIWQNWQFMHSLTNFETMPGRPNATFAEADWLGMYLALFVSVVYCLIYYLTCQANYTLEEKFKVQSSKFKITVQNSKLILFYILLTISYVLLILTVSRSAWLGAFFATFIFLWAVFTDFKFKFNDWQWKETIKIKLGILCSLIISLAVVYVFHLTNFQLFNRAISTGTGLQKITISCQPNFDCAVPQTIGNESQLASCGCRHINLEEINIEKSKGYMIEEVYRQDPNVKTRSEIYRKSWEQIRSHPLLGIGWGSISNVLGKDERGAGLNSSNIFLEIWLGSGLVGFLAFVIFWFYLIFNAVKKFYSSSDALQKSIYLFIMISWFGIAICNLFNAGILLGFLWIWMGLSLIKE
jgi:hypothetical protein